MKEIRLGRHSVALIDDEDYPLVSKYKWGLWRATDTLAYAGRYSRRTDGKYDRLFMHREILGLRNSQIRVDHKNRDGLDNRRKNLRFATHQQNCFNRDFRRCNKSGEVGVFWHKGLGLWRAVIQVRGKKIYLGSSKHKEVAIKLRREATPKYFGDFAPV